MWEKGRKPSLLSGSYYCVDLEVICNVAVMCPVNITLKCGLDWLQVYFPHNFEQHCKQCSIIIIVASQVAVSNTVPCIRCVLPRRCKPNANVSVHKLVET